MSNSSKFEMKAINPENISDIDPLKISFITLIDGSIIVVNKNYPIKINNNKKKLIRESVLFVISSEQNFSINSYYKNKEIKSNKNNFWEKKSISKDEEEKSINNTPKTRIKTSSIKNDISKNFNFEHNEENSFLNSISNDLSQTLRDLLSSSFIKNTINNKISNKTKNKKTNRLFSSECTPSYNVFVYPKKKVKINEGNNYKKKSTIKNKNSYLRDGFYNSTTKYSNNFLSNYMNIKLNSQTEEERNVKVDEKNISQKFNKLLNKIHQNKIPEYKTNFVSQKQKNFHNLYKLECNNFCSFDKFKTNRNVPVKKCSSLTKRIQTLQDKSKNNTDYYSADNKIINVKRFSSFKNYLVLPSNKY